MILVLLNDVTYEVKKRNTTNVKRGRAIVEPKRNGHQNIISLIYR
jgi:hypothetical protein